MANHIGTALVVPDRLSPENVFIREYGENHAVCIAPNRARSFEYLILVG